MGGCVVRLMLQGVGSSQFLTASRPVIQQIGT